MTDRDPKPEKPSTPAPQPRVHSIRFTSPQHLTGVSTVQDVRPKEFEIAVVGPSVFVKARVGESLVTEVPRPACIVRWTVPEGMSFEDVVKAVGPKR